MPKVVTAALIVIGDEILSGKTQDANTQALAKALNTVGVQLREVRTIPDDKATIVNAINHFRSAVDYVFTTGGIGPTHDDITAESLAEAFDRKLVIDPDAYDELEAYYLSKGEAFTPARQKMVTMPEGAKPIRNDVTIAPGIHIENVYTLAGVPSIMRSMLEYILPTLQGGVSLVSYSISTNIGESTFADGLTEIQIAHPEVVIGSYPKFDGGELKVTIIMRHADTDRLEVVMDTVSELIQSKGGRVLSAGRLLEG